MVLPDLTLEKAVASDPRIAIMQQMHRTDPRIAGGQ